MRRMPPTFRPRPKPVSHRGQIMYWLVAILGPDDRSIAGKYGSYDEADEVGRTKLDCQYKIYELPTIDKATASGMIKWRMWQEEGIPLRRSLTRFNKGMDIKPNHVPTIGVQD